MTPKQKQKAIRQEMAPYNGRYSTYLESILSMIEGGKTNREIAEWFRPYHGNAFEHCQLRAVVAHIRRREHIKSLKRQAA